MFQNIIQRKNRTLLAISLAGLMAGFTSVKAADKLTDVELAKKWQAVKAHVLTEKEFVKIAKGNVKLDKAMQAKLKADPNKLTDDDIKQIQKLLGKAPEAATTQLTDAELAAKWTARKEGKLTDAEFTKIAKGKYEFNEEKKDVLEKAPYKFSRDEIDTMEKLIGEAKEDTFSLFQVMAGVKFENPYSIALTPAVAATATNAASPASAALKSKNSKTDGFLELSFSTRYIFRTGQFDYGTTLTEEGESKPDWRFPVFNGTTENRTAYLPELDFTLGYVFRGSEAPTSVTTSTITGGSDFYSDLAIGLPFLRYRNEGGKLKLETSVEFDGGFVTDKDFNRLHSTLFAGVGLQFAKLTSANKLSPGDVYVMARVGGAQFERPMLNGTTVVLDQFDLPRYEKTYAVSAGANFVYRISESVLLRAGGNVYFKEHASWNLSAALSLDPSKVFSTGKKE